MGLCPDGPRYKAIGNSKAVTVVRWIGNDAAHPNKDVVTKEDVQDRVHFPDTVARGRDYYTPYRAMLPQLKHMMDTRGVEVVLLFGSRTEEDLIYREDFYAFAEAHPNFRFVPCFSRELPADPHPDVRQGYVQDVLAEFAPSAEGDIAYLCGNPNMVDATFEVLKAAGLPVPHIRREKYVSSK